MTESRHLTTLARIALLVTACDLGSKAMAKELWSGEAKWFASWLHFSVVHNDSGAFGWSVGAYTWQLNLALTLSAIAFIIPVSRDLTRIDAQAPRALGLIVGGALGNLASLVTSPYGVVDFIQVDLAQVGIALNVADVAAYAGLAMIVRTGALVVAALRRESRLREPARATAVRSVFAEKARLSGLVRASRGGVPSGAAALEVTVIDFNRVAGTRPTPGDARPRAEGVHDALTLGADVVDEPRGRTSGVVGDISPARARNALGNQPGDASLHLRPSPSDRRPE